MSINLNLVVIVIFLALAQVFQAHNAITKTQKDETNDIDFTFLITGGFRPEQHSLAKYAVSIRSRAHRQYFGDNHFCGGCIIGPRTILTAAHCATVQQKDASAITVRPTSGIRVVAKSTNRLEKTDDTLILDVETIRIHPSYDPINMIADIAILKLQEDIKIDGVLADIIPIANSSAVPGTHCTVIGWGRIFINGPMAANAIYVNVDINSDDNCAPYASYTHGMLCVSDLDDYKLDSCSGDSGGPLICESKLVGLVSYGYGCGSGLPGIYTDVWHYRSWVMDNCCSSYGANFTVIFVLAIMIIIFQYNQI